MHRLLAMLCSCLAAATPTAGEEFRDVTAELGIDFVHQDGRSGEKFYIESAASGGGFLDFDGDGDLDIYLLNGAVTPGSKIEGTPRNALYEQREGRFHDVSERAGVGDTGYGMGFCAGDVDADGRLDFLVTNYGADRLYRNLGDGKFRDEAVKRGVAGERWGTSCAFADLDQDGDLDLYVANYVHFRFDQNPFCGDRARGLRAYCRPEAFDGQTDYLYINQGDGTFREEGQQRGLAKGANEKGFGVVVSDVDDDGDPDIYVANDGTLNRLYVNNGKGRFEDQALLSGLGLNARGLAESGMGVALGDADGDRRLDFVVTNYSMETNTLYRNQGGLLFEDVTRPAGLKEATYPYVGWGVAFFDADNDGDLDLATANGHAVDNIEIFEAGLSYRQPNLLFENDGKGRFRAIGEGEVWSRKRVSRALAVGDYDDDGRLDLLITNTNDPPELLRNVGNTGHPWLGVRLEGPPGNPFAIGARITLEAAGQSQVREVRSGGSFMAQSDLRQHFGFGPQAPTGPVRLTIRWPNGRIQSAEVPRLNAYATIAYEPR